MRRSTRVPLLLLLVPHLTSWNALAADFEAAPPTPREVRELLERFAEANEASDAAQIEALFCPFNQRSFGAVDGEGAPSKWPSGKPKWTSDFPAKITSRGEGRAVPTFGRQLWFLSTGRESLGLFAKQTDSGEGLCISFYDARPKIRDFVAEPPSRGEVMELLARFEKAHVEQDDEVIALVECKSLWPQGFRSIEGGRYTWPSGREGWPPSFLEETVATATLTVTRGVRVWTDRFSISLAPTSDVDEIGKGHLCVHNYRLTKLEPLPASREVEVAVLRKSLDIFGKLPPGATFVEGDRGEAFEFHLGSSELIITDQGELHLPPDLAEVLVRQWSRARTKEERTRVERKIWGKHSKRLARSELKSARKVLAREGAEILRSKALKDGWLIEAVGGESRRKVLTGARYLNRRRIMAVGSPVDGAESIAEARKFFRSLEHRPDD